jgi:hypothetical protein
MAGTVELLCRHAELVNGVRGERNGDDDDRRPDSACDFKVNHRQWDQNYKQLSRLCMMRCGTSTLINTAEPKHD